MLVLPDWVADSVAREQIVDEQLAIGREFTRMLKAIDENLSCVMAKENAKDPRLMPGCWHFMRLNPGLPPSYMPITTREGGYREPSLRDLEEVHRRDLWRSPRALDDYLAVRRKTEAEAERARELWHEQARDELAENYRAAKRVAGDGGLDRKVWGKR